MRIVKDAFGSLWRGTLALVAASRQRRAIRELQSFDSRTLADIGIKPGDIEFAVRHGRPSQVDQVNVVPFARSIERRKADASPLGERTPPLHVILLIFGLVPFGAMLSCGSSATKVSSQGELRINGTEGDLVHMRRPPAERMPASTQ